jgi:hypothetical protein
VPPEASQGFAELVTVVRLQAEPDSGVVRFAQPIWLGEAQDGAPDRVVEGQPDASGSSADGEPTRVTAQLGTLLAGALPIDLPTLERAAVKVLARLEGLAEGIAAAPATLSLTQWLVAVAAVVVFEFARRRAKPLELSGSVRGDGGRVPSWAPFPILAMLPPEDEP